MAPAEPSLNFCFCSFVWDSRAQNALVLYIHNIVLSREVVLLNSRDRMAFLEEKGASNIVVAVVFAVFVLSARTVAARATSNSN